MHVLDVWMFLDPMQVPLLHYLLLNCDVQGNEGEQVFMVADGTIMVVDHNNNANNRVVANPGCIRYCSPFAHQRRFQYHLL